MAIECKLNVLLAERSTRERRRIALTEVRDKTGITWPTLQKWALGKAKSYNADILSKLCEYFNCQPGDILGFSPDVN